ncbi:NDR1/HIN1-like protein 13 [Ziziphus jujuba]|uniref:NDR1/HIN1-like protein 13 n=1 Tax=Ziziphus jujuba TaxID=326968 RepID=A0A6P3ZIE1_ZIZJJ|nr:NDR1/HIN1-like protein 13 [Ziziphus jujuba]
MTDRVHPQDDSAPLAHPSTTSSPNNSSEFPKRPSPPSPEKPVPPPGTYVIQIPKDTVYRVPPPENAKKYQQLSRRKSNRRPCCCCCLCWLLGLIVILIVLAGISAGVLYLVFRPESPKYTVDDVSIKGINLTSSSSSSVISPTIDVEVRAENPNDKIGIYYEKDSSVRVYFSDVKLCDGVLPKFYQPSNNVTVFKTTLAGSGIEFTESVHKSLRSAQSQGRVPLELKLRAPVKIKVGSVKTWTITVKVNCDITVDKLTAEAKIVSKKCDYDVDLW